MHEGYSINHSHDADCEAYYLQHAATVDVTSKQDDYFRFFDMITRIVDIVIGTIGLIISIPVLLLFGIFIKMEDGGPVFYSQERVGLYGKHFTLYKLRSMRMDAEKNGAQWASKDDERVTKVGQIVRRTRIDELPQFTNILRGDMTIVGPRPERPEFIIKFDQEMSGFIERLQVKPGLTGWAQVNGGYDIGPEEKLKLDIFYIENRSLLLDLKIMAKTVRVMFTGNGAR